MGIYLIISDYYWRFFFFLFSFSFRYCIGGQSTINILVQVKIEWDCIKIFLYFFTWSRWAVSTVMTRQNSVPGDDGRPSLALIPFYDMANHANGPVCHCLFLLHLSLAGAYICTRRNSSAVWIPFSKVARDSTLNYSSSRGDPESPNRLRHILRVMRVSICIYGY